MWYLQDITKRRVSGTEKLTSVSIILVDFEIFWYNTHAVADADLTWLLFFLSSGLNPATYRVRVGSTFASSGGVVHAVQQVINHPNYNDNTLDNDIAILRLASFITFSNVVQAGAIAGTNYNVADNQPVWAIGWGVTEVTLEILFI